MPHLKKALLLAAIGATTVTFTGVAQADLLSAEVGVAAWQATPSGWAEDSSHGYTGKADLEDDLHLDDKTTSTVWARLVHPIPIIPNVQLRYTPLKISGSGHSNFSFKGHIFNAVQKTHGELDLDQFDATLFYNPWDTVVSVDLGINVKFIKGKITARSSTQSVKEDFNAAIPMLYGRVGLKVPATDLRFDLKASTISYDGNHLSDVTASARYTVLGLVGIEAGYRAEQLKLDDVDDVSADIKFKGPYLGVSIGF